MVTGNSHLSEIIQRFALSTVSFTACVVCWDNSLSNADSVYVRATRCDCRLGSCCRDREDGLLPDMVGCMNDRLFECVFVCLFV